MNIRMFTTCFLLYLVHLDVGPEGWKHVGDNTVKLRYKVMKWTEYSVSLQTSVGVIEE